MRNILLILVGLIVFGKSSFGQLANISYDFDDTKCTITYDLSSTNRDNIFTVVVRGSQDSFANALKLVSGDVGEYIRPGLNKKIIWDYKNELPKDFEGNITLKVEVLQIIIPLEIRPLSKKVYKKSEKIRIEWSGGNGEIANLALLKNGVKTQDIATVDEMSYRYDFTLPKSKGSNYSIQLSEPNNPKSVSTDLFRIKPKTPFIVKFLIVAAIGTGVYLATQHPSPNPIPPCTTCPIPSTGLPDPSVTVPSNH